MNSTFNEVFDQTQLATLRATLDRLIPEDDNPSACAVGVDVFITGLLQSILNETVAEYRHGLDSLNAEAIAVYGTAFAHLDTSDKDSLLSLIEQGQTQLEWTVSSTDFFTALVNLTMDGYYGTPASESGQDCPAWEMVGFDPYWTIRAPESAR